MDEKVVRQIMSILKLTDFSVVIGKTNMGELCFKYTKDVDLPVFTLDAVPLSKEFDSELYKLLGIHK